MKRIVILGGGTGGTIMANRLRAALDADAARITVIDRDDVHVYQPGLLFVPFGLADPAEIVRSRRAQLHRGVEFVQAAVTDVDVEAETVQLDDGSTHGYDVLIIASGARLQPDETPGMTDPGWGETVLTFYDRPGAAGLTRALRRFTGGRIVVNMVDLPVKCPVAPLEFAFLADWYLRERGIRGDTSLSFVTPLDGAFTKPVASEHLGSLLADKGIDLVTEFATGEVDADAGRLVSYDDREVPFDLLVAIPLHGGAEFVDRSAGLGDELGFVLTDPRTLQSRAAPNVFAIGDATDLPASKAGSVTHFEADVLTENVLRHLRGDELAERFDGHSNCFVETGFRKALLIDFNYETEPLPGRFPGALGPLPLLEESHLNHLGKLMFQSIYWHILLPGRNIPGIPAVMSMAGKRVPSASDMEVGA